jgi:hypothetical protein
MSRIPNPRTFLRRRISLFIGVPIVAACGAMGYAASIVHEHAAVTVPNQHPVEVRPGSLALPAPALPAEKEGVPTQQPVDQNGAPAQKGIDQHATVLKRQNSAEPAPFTALDETMPIATAAKAPSPAPAQEAEKPASPMPARITADQTRPTPPEQRSAVPAKRPPQAAARYQKKPPKYAGPPPPKKSAAANGLQNIPLFGPVFALFQ